MTITTDAVLRAVAAYGLLGTAAEWPTAPLDEAQWRELVASTNGQRVAGLLAHAVADGVLPATDPQFDEALDSHTASMSLALLLEQELLEIVGLLGRGGVEPRVLKGSAAAYLDYPDPSVRSFGDVDLLVRPDAFDAAVRALVEAGYERRFPEPRPGFDRRFSKGTSFRTPRGSELDLHRTFVMGPFGLRVDLDELWSRAATFELAGIALEALSREDRFVHACFHAALGDNPPRLVPLRDVAEILLSGSLDVDAARAIATRWGADAVVARAVRLAWEAFSLGDSVGLSAWARTYRPSAVEERALAAYLASDRDYAGKSAAAVRAIPGLRNKAAFVWALTFPDRTYLDGRHRGNGRRLLRATRSVTRAVRR